jgi:chemotaxis family two-component system sensor kinase Cph1
MPDIHQINCENEPIHIPGRIQDNGFLLAADAGTKTIQYLSENLHKYTGIFPKDVLGKSLNDFISRFTSEATAERIYHFLEHTNLGNHLGKNSIDIKDIGGNDFVLIAHNHRGKLIIDVEVLHTHEAQDGFDFSEAYANIVSFDTVEERCDYLAEQIRQFSNYDRVMIYKFDEEYNGEVIAERTAPGVHSFMQHRFPSTDIPAQARELYVKNLMRIIADVNQEGSGLLAIPEAVDQPLDMSFSTLRAVSPVHIAYLKNMGVGASFSTSIIVQGKLWGLVACHHFTPALISYHNRFNCRTLTQILGNGIHMLHTYQANTQKEKYSRAFSDTLKVLALNSDLHQVLKYKLNESTGAAYIKGNEVDTVGTTPSRNEILEIADYVFDNSHGKIFHTQKLGSKLNISQNTLETASGILAIPMARELREMIIWFKPEMPTQVKWAGNPEKIITEYKGKPSLNPRTSFLSWSEKVSGLSAEWSLGEIATAEALQQEIEHIIHLKAQEIKLLHERLRLAYDELSTFSYTVSHDLKVPLTGIQNYTELIAATETGLSADGKSYLETVVYSANKMNTLINEIFNYTRAGLIDIRTTEVKMRPLIDRIVEENKAIYKDSVQVETGELLNVVGDEMMIYQVFSNLISNAIKYSSKSEKARVTIESARSGNKIIYKIKDNGIGIPPEGINKLFLPFERMSNAKEFDGTGLGMAIVKRLADKHRAELEITSELNKGTECTIIFTDKI